MLSDDLSILSLDSTQLPRTDAAYEAWKDTHLLPAWHAFAKKNHPDKGGDSDMFIRGKGAYDRLLEAGYVVQPIHSPPHKPRSEPTPSKSNKIKPDTVTDFIDGLERMPTPYRTALEKLKNAYFAAAKLPSPAPYTKKLEHIFFVSYLSANSDITVIHQQIDQIREQIDQQVKKAQKKKRVPVTVQAHVKEQAKQEQDSARIADNLACLRERIQRVKQTVHDDQTSNLPPAADNPTLFQAFHNAVKLK